ncbi:MAG: hypothetical protein OHK0044_10110 [Burkholderiaceae bacterium]
MQTDLEGRAPGEPPNGDFVAYLQDLERRQVAAMNPPHAIAPAAPQPGAKAAPAAEPLPRDAAQALVERLRARRAASPLSVAALLMAVVGAAALGNALFGDGGIVALAVGVALLWRPVGRLIDAVRATTASSARPRNAVDAALRRNGSDR